MDPSRQHAGDFAIIAISRYRQYSPPSSATSLTNTFRHTATKRPLIFYNAGGGRHRGNASFLLLLSLGLGFASALHVPIVYARNAHLEMVAGWPSTQNRRWSQGSKKWQMWRSTATRLLYQVDTMWPGEATGGLRPVRQWVVATLDGSVQTFNNKRITVFLISFCVWFITSHQYRATACIKVKYIMPYEVWVQMTN